MLTVAELTERIRARVVETPELACSVLLDFGGAGAIRIDARERPAVVDNQRLQTDCAIALPLDLFVAIARGEQNARLAYMLGKVRITGDPAVALQLQGMLG